MDRPLLATLIRRLHLAIRREIHADLRRAGFTDLSPAHVYVFQTPGPEGMRPRDLAVRTNMSKQAMNHLLVFLEGHGYLRRAGSPDDRRGKVVRLTPRGKEVASVIQASATRIEGDWTALLGRERVESLRNALVDADTLSASPASCA